MGSLSLSAQIDVMIAEVLLAMSGIEGSYIRTTKSHQGILAHHRKLRDVALIVAGDDLDRSVADQVAGLLPLCQSTLIVREFVRTHSQYHYGLVSHALAAEVRTLLREVDVLISHLDELFRNGQLTLQKLIFMLQPTATIMRNLADLCTKLERTRGGEMLDVLYGSIFEQGDAKTRELYTSVFYKAIHPFIKMLENWLFRGKLEDVFDEFLVRENGLASREALAKDFHSQYWDERFTLNDKHIPRFLVPFAIKILVAGKYLNVVRDTKNVSIFGIIKDSERDNAMEIAPDESSALQGDDVEYDPSPAPLLSRATPLLTEESVDKDDGSSGLSLAFDMDAQDKLALSADRCYRLSSRALLKLLEQEHGLTAHLRSLRCYFLLEHGDFFTQFMDLAQVDLAKEVKEIRLVRVQVYYFYNSFISLT